MESTSPLRLLIKTDAEHIVVGKETKTISEWLKLTEEEALAMGLQKRLYQDYIRFFQWYSINFERLK